MVLSHISYLHYTYIRLISKHSKKMNFSHRVDMLRPLSQVEIIPMPYVTEATKVNIILPVTVHEAEALSKFLAVYEKVWLIFMVFQYFKTLVQIRGIHSINFF